MCNTYVVRLLCSIRAILSQVPLLQMYGIVAVVTGPRVDVGLSVVISVTVSVSSNKVLAVVVLVKALFR